MRVQLVFKLFHDFAGAWALQVALQASERNSYDIAVMEL
jgi:hypothetical protein